MSGTHKRIKTIGIMVAVLFVMVATPVSAIILRVNEISVDGLVTIDVAGGGGLIPGHYYNLHDDTGYNGTLLVQQVTKYFAKGVISKSGWRARKDWYYTFIPVGASVAPLQKKPAKILTLQKSPAELMVVDKDPLVGKEPEKDRTSGKKSHVKVVELRKPRKTETRSTKYSGTVLKTQEDTVRDKKKIDTSPVERRRNDGEVPARHDLIAPYGSTGFTLFPSARVIGQHRIRTVYTFSTTNADSIVTSLQNGKNSIMFKSKKHTFSVAWGLTANTEMSYSYSAIKDNLRLVYSPYSSSPAQSYDVKIYERTKTHALTIKRGLMGHGEGSHARVSLYLRGQREIFGEGDDDNVFAAAILDVPFWNEKAMGTAIYGVDDFAGENIERFGAGLRFELSNRFLAGVEWYRQSPGVDSAGPDDRESSAYTGQYRIDKEYFFNISYENMRNYLWGSSNEGSIKTVNFSLFHSQ